MHFLPGGHYVLMYCIYTAVRGFGVLLCLGACIHAVVRAVFPGPRETITIIIDMP